MISSDPDKFTYLVRAGKPCLEYLTLLKYLVCSELISKTPKKLPQEALPKLYCVKSHSNLVKMIYAKKPHSNNNKKPHKTQRNKIKKKKNPTSSKYYISTFLEAVCLKTFIVVVF